MKSSGRVIYRCFLSSLLLLSTTLVVCGQEGRVAAFTWENDTFAQIFSPYTDRHYTQGARLSYLHRDNENGNVTNNLFASATFLRWLPALGMPVERTKVGVALGQDIYTPECLASGSGGIGYCPVGASPMTDDRPYAAWLYAAALFQRRGLAWGKIPARDDLEIAVGVIGPEALGEEAQTTFHSFFRDAIKPEGWHNQLKTEPGLILRGRRSWLFTTSDDAHSWAVDAIPSAGFNLGNVATYLQGGALVRAGYGLPQDFMGPGGHRLGPRPALGVHVFAGLEGKLVGHDIFLDGNTYQSSQHVTKELLVAELKCGLAVQLSAFELSAAYVWRTREFTQQGESDAYLSGTIRVGF